MKSKRRQNQASNKASRKASIYTPGGKSKYAKKRLRSLRGANPNSPFYLSPAERAVIASRGGEQVPMSVYVSNRFGVAIPVPDNSTWSHHGEREYWKPTLNKDALRRLLGGMADDYKLTG